MTPSSREALYRALSADEDPRLSALMSVLRALGFGHQHVQGLGRNPGSRAAAGSALWESKPRTISFSDSAFHTESFNTGPLPLTPGARCVIFASIDKDYEQCTDNYELGWGAVDDSTYSKALFVYQNNSGNEANWTTQSWNGFGIDLAFKAVLK